MTTGPDADVNGDLVETVADETPGDDTVAEDSEVPAAGVTSTGNVRVDEAVERLDELETLPTAEHADVYEDVHRRLHAALTELDAD
jgi:hypothetical protein